MDFKNVKGRIKIVNKANGRIVSDAFTVMHDSEIETDTRRLPESVLDDLQYFYDVGMIEVELIDSDRKDKSNSEDVHNLTSETGVEHTVFKPSDRAINVQEIDTSGKSVEVGFAKIDAVEILQKHWKQLEKEVLNIKDKTKIQMLLTVARELEITGKKYSIIEDRFNQL